MAPFLPAPERDYADSRTVVSRPRGHEAVTPAFAPSAADAAAL